MGTYDSDIRSAYSMIKEAGQLGNLIPSTKSTRSSTGTVTVSESNSIPIYAVFLDSVYKTVNGTTTKIADHRVYVASYNLTVEPKINDLVEDKNSKKFQICDIETIQPSGDVILFIILVKRYGN